MKVSGLANEVIAAPANAEERLLKVCVRRTPLEQAWRIKIIVLHRIVRQCLPAVQDDTYIALLKKIN